MTTDFVFPHTLTYDEVIEGIHRMPTFQQLRMFLRRPVAKSSGSNAILRDYVTDGLVSVALACFAVATNKDWLTWEEVEALLCKAPFGHPSWLDDLETALTLIEFENDHVNLLMLAQLNLAGCWISQLKAQGKIPPAPEGAL